MKRRKIIPCLFLTVALCGCTTQTVEDAKQIEESKTYVSKYEYETNTDGKIETQVYSEEKPTFTDWETVTGITLSPYDYKDGTVKYQKMNEKWTYSGCECSVTEAVVTKDINYAYEIMNEDSARLMVNKLNKSSLVSNGYIDNGQHILWIKLHIKYNGEKDNQMYIAPFFVKKEEGHIKTGGIMKLSIQDELCVVNPEKYNSAFNIMLQVGEDRDYWLVCDISKYNPETTKYYMSGRWSGYDDTNSQSKYNGNFIELEIEDKTER